MWGGKLRLSTPMLFAIGLVAMFTIGGLSGVTHAVAPSDTQQTDTYYIVAHFHYVLFGGAFLGFLGGFYFWWPKVFGHTLGDKMGKWHFWIILIGFNLTFGPMHILGLQGMPRRTYTYRRGYGFDLWNMVSTIGAFTIAVSMIIFFTNIVLSRRKARANVRQMAADPWDGRSLEWMVASPTPEHNFDEIPVVRTLDDFWHRKYGENEAGKLVRIAATEDVIQDGSNHDVHLPSPSYWPLVLASGLPLIAWGLIYNLWLAVVGGLFVVSAIYGWVMEPSVDDEAPHAGHDDHDGSDGGNGEAEADADEAGGDQEEAALVD
jgi:cytochrome c oxidase subunit I